jgi:hypothetical protein
MSILEKATGLGSGKSHLERDVLIDLRVRLKNAIVSSANQITRNILYVGGEKRKALVSSVMGQGGKPRNLPPR